VSNRFGWIRKVRGGLRHGRFSICSARGPAQRNIRQSQYHVRGESKLNHDAIREVSDDALRVCFSPANPSNIFDSPERNTRTDHNFSEPCRLIHIH